LLGAGLPLPAASLAIASLIHSQGMGDRHKTYLTTQRDGFDLNAYIGEWFETAYTVKPYDYGFGLARAGYPCKKLPPGLERAIEKR
jgi:hypothetical protein